MENYRHNRGSCGIMRITNKSDNETNMSESKTKRNNNRADRGANRRAGNTPKLTAEQKRDKLARELNIKPKTRQLVDNLIANPKLTQTQAYIDLHKTENRKTAAIAASKLLQKPSVQIYRDSAISKAKRRIVSLVDSNNESIALKASDSILDRSLGKAVQRTETEGRTVHVSLDVSGLRMASHYIEPSQTPSIGE